MSDKAITEKAEIRPYEEDDASEIIAMLNEENVPSDESLFRSGVTNVLCRGKGVIGFYTITIDHQYPHLRHFCIKRSKRTTLDTYKLIRSAKRLVLMCGYANMIVHGRGTKLIRFLWTYWKCAPYKQAEDGTAFFFVRI